MRYGMPVSGGMLATHFGHCEAFALFDVDENTKEIVGRDVVASPGHSPGVLPAFLAEQGASVIIAGGMGSRAVSLFEENRIHVVLGAPEGDPEDVMKAYLAGTLATVENVCDH
ncbi:MAG: NifB/NifX family molybdenum-iron cluster-binding protein [Dehalococcoidia bacterium]|nr:NifB/NifX family molybdenum-iron cluster-binding protein [Dehalococcoidia bacterium]